jgi:hypothetical protein
MGDALMRWLARGYLAPFGLALVLATLASAGEVGCYGSLPHPLYVGQSTQALENVGFPPPPARVEFIPKQPAKNAVWIDGEWEWQGRRWRWRLGRWVTPPEGVRFAPWAVVYASDGTVYSAPGIWRDAQGREVTEPASLAIARTNLADVVDPEGNLETTGPSLKPESDPREHEDAGVTEGEVVPADADVVPADAAPHD